MATMTAERRFDAVRRRGLGWWPALWLTLCLLLAQHLGIVHRIQHGGLQEAALASVTVASPLPLTAPDDSPVFHADLADTLKSSGHSCVLFDAATGADTLCDGPPMPALAHGKPVLPPSITWRWPHLPPARPFLSRAPPSPFAFA